MSNKRLVVIGGGAAGIYCAVNAARLDPGLKVSVLEKTGKLLSKVKVSGGGRCNVTNACEDLSEMARRYPRGQHFVRKSFHRWFTGNVIRWFAERGVELKAEADGRMFPITDSSQTIIDCLLREAEETGVRILTNTEVKRIDIEGGGEELEEKTGNDRRHEVQAGGATGRRFLLHVARTGSGSADWAGERGEITVMEADYVCVACGGYPKSVMFDWIQQTGHTIEEPVPSLFTFNMPGHSIRELMGVAVPDAQVKIVGSKLQERGPVLITHWGLSGPAVLRLSAWGARELAGRNYQFSIVLNWIPEYNEQTAREKLQEVRYERAAHKIGAKNPFGLPQRLWEYWLKVVGIPAEGRWADLPARDQNRLISQLCASELAVQGKTTFKEEFVTAGGIKLSEVDPSTMQSRKVPGLFFAGEVLDVDGITGGFNFQHAWTSGRIAAETIAAVAVSQGADR